MSMICKNCGMLTEPMDMLCEFCGENVHEKKPYHGQEDIEKKEETDFGSITTHYPKGKLNIYDEGATKVAMYVSKGRLVIDFQKPTVWIGLGKDEVETWIRVMQKRLSQLS